MGQCLAACCIRERNIALIGGTTGYLICRVTSVVVSVLITRPTHTVICAHNSSSPYVQFLRPTACLLFVSTLQFSLALASVVSLSIRFRCSSVKMSRLGAWESQWCPPQLQMVYFGIVPLLHSVSDITNYFYIHSLAAQINIGGKYTCMYHLLQKFRSLHFARRV